MSLCLLVLVKIVKVHKKINEKRPESSRYNILQSSVHETILCQVVSVLVFVCVFGVHFRRHNKK